MYALRAFGALVLDRDGAPIHSLAAHRNALAILTVLATDGLVTRDRLMALLWPDSDLDRARGSLKQALHTLRQHLACPDLVVGRAGLGLNAALIESDVGRFQDALRAGNLLEAVTLYQGPFLDGVHLNGAPELEQWVEARRATLAQRYREGLERLAQAAEARNEPGEAIRWWTRLAGDDPLDGKAALHLMQALEEGGRRAAALQHFKAHEQVLQRELGLAPDPAAIALANRLLHHSVPAVAWNPAPAPAAPRDVTPASPASRAASPPVLLRWIGPIALGAIVVAGLAIAASRRPDPDIPSDPNLVAIAPFDVLDPSLDLWGEGLMDVLTEDLDGAGPLRTVDQAVALRHWTGRANRGSAERLGGLTGAGLIVYGKVARRGEDSVSIRATLLNRSPAEGGADLVEVAGPEGRMGELVDSLGVNILRALGRGRAIGSQRRVSIGSRSLSALKEFLQGEQFYRQGHFDSALARYDQAIAEDSTFALALRRMAWAVALGAVTSWKYASQDQYLQQAVRHNHGLSPRDSVLLRVDSLLVLGTRSNQAGEIVASLMTGVRNLEELARRYPDDPAIWYELGEHRYHGIPPLGTPALALDAFERAIALDSGFAPAYQHTVKLAIQMGRLDRARHYARAYAVLHPGNAHAPGLGLALMVLDSGGVHHPRVWREIQQAPGSALMWAGHDHFRWMVDTAETAVVLLRELIAGQHDLSGSGALSADSILPLHLAVALVFRGHLREAAEVSQPLLNEEGIGFYRFSIDRFLDLALWDILPDSVVRRTYQLGLLAGTDWNGGTTFSNPRFLRALPYWFARGDTLSVIRFQRRAAEVARAGAPGVAELRGRYFEIAARGYLALMRGDSAEAQRVMEGIPDTLCLIGTCFSEQLLLAQLLVARNADRQAAAILDRWALAGDNTTFAVIAALERGKIAERLGDRALAVERYQFVLDAWRRADPELQPFVRVARAGLSRVARADQ